MNVIVAASFLAAIGDDRTASRSPRKLVGYLGLDPRVRQSGVGPAHARAHLKAGLRPRRATRWSRRAGARCASPVRCSAFYQRIRARRGHHVAIVAAARKLACLFWCLLTREEDYAYQQPSLTKKKLRRLEITAGAERYTPRPPASGPPTTRSARPSASSPARPRSPTRAPCATGMPPRPGKRARV